MPEPSSKARSIARRCPKTAPLGALTLASALACGTAEAPSEAADTAAGSVTAGEADTEGASDEGGGASGQGDQDGAAGSDGGEGGTTTGAGPDTGGASEGRPGCPRPLPEGWVHCEDFEAVVDPADVFFEYYDGEGAFVLTDEEAASGHRSMRASYRAGVEGAGWLSVSFGENPIIYGQRPQVAKDQKFDEIYWRFRIKMEAGWPDVGPRKLTRITAFAHENWGQAMVASLWSDGSDVVLAAEPSSCVLEDEVVCQGYNDADGLQSLGPLVGTTPLFSNKYADAWHCVEGHVRLNTPGEVDGVLEFWVDDMLEAGRYDIDWRGNWDDYGLNLVTVENFWTGGAPQALDRWIDDLVIATVPIGCD